MTKAPVSCVSPSSGSGAFPAAGQRPSTGVSLSVLALATAFTKETRAWDIVFAEIVRQLHSECKERGHLLNTIRNRFRQLQQLLLQVIRAQQRMLEAYHVRQQEMRPKTRAVDRAYRKARRAAEAADAVQRMQEHQAQLSHVRVRLERMEADLGSPADFGAAGAPYAVVGAAGGLASAATPPSPGPSAQTRAQSKSLAYLEARQSFRGLLRDLNALEKQETRLKTIVSEEGAEAEAVREAMELHRQHVQERQRLKAKRLGCIVAMQARFRGNRDRKKKVAPARIALRQRRLAAEAERRRQEILAAKVRVARFFQHCYRRWRLLGLFERGLVKLRELERQAREGAAGDRKKRDRNARISWRTYLRSCRRIQRAYRRRLMTKPRWRRRWMKNLKQEAEAQLLGRITDKEQRTQVQSIIRLHTQEQEELFLDRLKTLHERSDYLERKLLSVEEQARKKIGEALHKGEMATKGAAKLVELAEDKCSERLRKKDIEIHYLSHKLHVLKRDVVAQSKEANEESSAVVLKVFQERLQKLRGTVAGQSQVEDETYGETVPGDSSAGEGKFPADTRRAISQSLGLLGETATALGDALRRKEAQRSALAARVRDLEEELRSFDPGHLRHESDAGYGVLGRGSPGRQRRHSVASISGGLSSNLRAASSTKGAVAKGPSAGRRKTSRRPSIVRAHKTTGIM